MPEPDELDAARLLFPVGDRVSGRVSSVPHPGRIGIFIDLGQPPAGFVDILNLPHDPSHWPKIGVVTEFEVIQHRRGQVRLWPLDARYRSSSARLAMTQEQWEAAKQAFPVGTVVVAEVTDVFPANREYVVHFDGRWVALPWTGEPPVVGEVGEYVVARHTEATRRILLSAIR